MKHSRNLISKSVFARSTVTLFAALCCISATASAAEPKYTMTTIKDLAHGATIDAGKYEQAIEKITAIDDDVDTFFRNTNLCVAYTKTGNLDDALLACDSAVEQVDNVSFDQMSFAPKSFERRMRSKYLAVSLSNRGVLHALMGDVELARRDFVEALSSGTYKKVVKINLARLDKGEAKKV